MQVFIMNGHLFIEFVCLFVEFVCIFSINALFLLENTAIPR
jgi:hypothetical protein